MYKSDFLITRYGLEVRLVNISDASFIYSLRSDKELTKFISQVNGTLEDQIGWINKYKIREGQGKEYYFIFLFKGVRQGLARIYDIENDHFTQGSWLFKRDAVDGSSILGNIISCELGFELSGIKYMLTDARKGNNTHKYVRAYHPEILKETELDIFYKIPKDNYIKYKKRFINLAYSILLKYID